MPPVLEPTELADRLLQGDRQALSRAITAVESAHPGSDALLHEVVRRGARRASVIGVTGPPGAGKSTLVGRIVTALLAGGQRVGVLLVDPSSPVSGGAVLADRVRMQRQGRNDQLYVRSVASRGQAGGLSATTGKLVRLLDGWGASIILLETVGAGQGEVEVCHVADRTVVVCPPGLGDELQAMKAGLMEVADIFVVNKADRPEAGQTVASLADAGPGGTGHGARPVLRTVATTGEGVPELIAELERQVAALPATAPSDGGVAATRATVAACAGRLVGEAVMASDAPLLDALVAGAHAGEADLEQAAASAARLVVEAWDSPGS
jgi:LAO/AO transport system kinase